MVGVLVTFWVLLFIHIAICEITWGFSSSSSAFLLSSDNLRQKRYSNNNKYDHVFVTQSSTADPTVTNSNTDEATENDGRTYHDDDNDNDHNDDDGIDSKNMLTFQSTFQTKSNPLPKMSEFYSISSLTLPLSSSSSSSNLTLGDFLIDPKHLLRAGESVQMKVIPTTKKLFEEWTVACNRVGAKTPLLSTTKFDANVNANANVQKGFIVSVRTAGISIPGLTVEWSALIGTNLVEIHNENKNNNHNNQQPQQLHYPELELVLIKDESKVSGGAKHIVWIYNKLTQLRSYSQNKNNNNKQTKNEKRKKNIINTTLFTRLGFSGPSLMMDKKCNNKYNADEEEDEEFVIRCIGTMEMKFRISTMMRKLLFLSSDDETVRIKKERSENKINNIITKYIVDDTKQHINIWEELFLSWVDTDSHPDTTTNKEESIIAATTPTTMMPNNIY